MTSLVWHYSLCEIEEGLTITAPHPGNPAPTLLGYPQLLLPVTLSHFPERIGYLVFLLMDYTLAPSSWGDLAVARHLHKSIPYLSIGNYRGL